MTFDQALAELGIDREAGPTEARRAYLKLLKTRRPETDPQGFMRLRAAFDRVKDALATHEAFHRMIEARAEIPKPPPVVADPPDALADPGEASAPDQVATQDPARGGPPIAEGTATTEDEPAEEPPSEAAADRLLADGDRAGAAGEIARIFDAAVEELGRPPPFLKAMRLLLELHEHGELDAASPLEASVVAWLDASGQEVRVLRGNLAVAWAMTRELGALRRKFPSKARAAIARGVRTGNLGEVQPALAALRDARPRAAVNAGCSLRTSAPVLAAQFADILDPQAPPPVATTSQGWRGWWMIFVVVLPLLRAIGSASAPPLPSSSRDHERDQATYEQAVRRAAGGMSYSDRKLAVVNQARRISQHATARVGASLAIVDYPQMDTLANALADHADAGRCPSAWVSMRALEGLGSTGDEAVRSEVLALNGALTNFCPLDRKP